MKRYIYLISPQTISGGKFYNDLNLVLKTKKVRYFQLRLKKTSTPNLLKISKKIKKITSKNNVAFLINDKPIVAKMVGADGCHIGQKDINFINARKILGKHKIIGITCHNSIKLAKEAIKNKANYIAFGAFFPTKTKKSKYRANITTLNKVKKLTDIPIVAIGGITNKNYKKLLLNNANFLAISGYIWNNKKYKPTEAIESLV